MYVVKRRHKGERGANMPKFTGAFAAPFTAGLLLVTIAGCTSASTTTAAATQTGRGDVTTAAVSGTASGTSSSSPSTPASTQPSTSAPAATPTPSGPPASSTPSQPPGENTPFPGIWDITSWAQYTAAQKALEDGEHQPWLLNAAMVVQAWASRWNPVPTVHQIAADTFQVTQPGTNTVYTIRGTRPIPRGPAPIWVITSITHS